LCLLLAMAQPARAQSRITVTGAVTDENREPLPGASVVCEGANQSAVADAYGNFSIAVAAGQRLTFSYLGYVSQTHAARERLDVQLLPGALRLDEVQVVAIGYGSVKKKDLTGAIATVGGERIAKSNSPTLLSALQGHVAADIGADWKPGGNPSIEIRGISSITGSNDPLWVVDGIPMNSSNVNLNPNDVLDVAVLKDASAAAIYGARGSNGVIIVTTRHAATGDANISVSYSGWVGIEKVTRRPNLLQGEAFADFKRQAWTNEGRDLAMAFDDVEQASLDAGRSTDWFDLVWGGTAVSTNHHLSFNAQGQRTGTMVSLGYLDQSSLISRAGFERYNMKFDNVFKFSDRLKITTTLLGTYSKSENYPGTVSYAYQLSPLGTPRDDAGNLKLYPNPKESLLTNPLMDVENTENTAWTYGLIGTTALEWNIWDGLSYKLSAGLDFSTSDNGYYAGSDTYARQGKPAEAAYSSGKGLSTTVDNVLTWHKELADIHRLDLMAGFNMEHAKSSSVYIRGTDMYYDALYWNLNAAVNVLDKNTSFSEWGILSWMGRANYSLLDRYLFTLTFRYDGSSRLAEEHKWAGFPSASVAWRLSEEAFMAATRDVLDNLKVRLSWGNTGNTNVSTYGTWGELGKTYYTFGDVPAIGTIPTGIPNPDLKWERTEEYNLGVDFGLFGGRLSGTLDIYQRTTKDLILNRKLPATSGYKTVQQNIGNTRNRGLELTLNGDVIRTKDLTWNLGAIFFTNKNEILDLYGDKKDDVGSGWFIGYPIRVNYLIHVDGVWQEEEAAEAANYYAKPGYPKYRDVTNATSTPSIGDEDRYIASKEPAWIGGLNTSVRYKWFDLYVALNARWGEKEIAGALSTGASEPGRYNMPVANYWTPENRSNTDPAPWASSSRYSMLNASDYYLRDVSFVRISTISLGYTFPKALVQKVRAENVKVYVNINNPFVFTPYPGQDPQALGTGYPAVTAFQLGLNLNF
jgi:TonB-linked SusC/RagA family outer membrane protein